MQSPFSFLPDCRYGLPVNPFAASLISWIFMSIVRVALDTDLLHHLLWSLGWQRRCSIDWVASSLTNRLCLSTGLIAFPYGNDSAVRGLL